MPVLGIAQPQQPFEMDHARKTCQDWRDTEARMANAEAFLKTLKPLLLKDAPGGAAYLTASRRDAPDRASRVRRDVRAVPLEQAAAGGHRRSGRRGSAQAVERDDFLTDNFLSDDKRYPVTGLGTNSARALGTNATRGQHLGSASRRRPTRSCRASDASRTCTTRAIRPSRSTFDMPGGGRGYYRTASLTSIWATAPYLHNNSVGIFIKDPSVQGRMTAFNDGMHEDALARAAAGRAVDSGDDGRQLA